MNRKRNIAWLNFLYSFFQMQILVKGAMAIGTIVAIIESTRGEFGEPFFTIPNMLSIFACILLLVEVAYKLLACIFTKKYEGYKFMIIALLLGLFSGTFYVISDQGLLVGLAFFAVAAIWFAANYKYVKNRKWVYGNPDML